MGTRRPMPKARGEILEAGCGLAIRYNVLRIAYAPLCGILAKEVQFHCGAGTSLILRQAQDDGF
jgi:hypothetical protein